MVKLLLVFPLVSVAFGGGILNPNSVDPSLFNVSTFAAGLANPTDITALASGAALLSTSPGFGASPGQLLYYTANGTPGPSVYTSSFNGSPQNGLLIGTAPLGNDLAVGTLTGAGLNTINILQPGATPSSPMSVVASLQMTYSPVNWEHDIIGMATRPTPGVPGSFDLILNVGAEGDNTPTPPGDTVALTGTGFSTPPSATLHGDSLYMVQIDMNGAQPTVTGVQQVATGIRNAYGIAFDAAGNLYFTDNGEDGSTSGPPPQADELNFISASQLGVGAPLNFGYPNCYTQYAWGATPGIQIGSGCIAPLVAFQPLTENGVQQELLAPTDLAFAPAGFPAPFNDGIFIGFAGGGGRPGEQSGVVFYSFATGTYLNFIESSNADVQKIVGVTSTSNALFISDLTGDNVFEITAAVPEPAPMRAGPPLFFCWPVS